MKKHNNLIQTNISKKKIDKIIIKFIMNIQEHELNWEENIIRNKNNENVKIFDKDNQFRISSDKKFEKKNEEEK